MTPDITEPNEVPRAKAPAKKRRKKIRKATVAKDRTGPGDEQAGITAKDCPTACTAERCVISTIGVCHHPFKTAPNGAGPITLANREKARKRIKHQMVDMKG